MGEKIKRNLSLFELPAHGEVHLPPFETTQMELVPQPALDQVEFDLRVQEAVKKKLLRHPARMDFGPGGRVYLFAYDFESGIEGTAKFRGIFASDISPDGRAMGSGYSFIELDEKDRERTRPIVGHTYTEPAFARQGLGLRRLIILNEANKKWFKDSLGSDSFVTEREGSSQAKRLWEQLETAGLAVKEDIAYRFKD